MVNCNEERNLKEVLGFAQQTAKAAGAYIASKFRSPFEVSLKGPSNPVTEVDLESERIICGAIREKYPSDAIVTEEGGGNDGATGWSWVIDPLDGTMNFSRGFPVFCVSIGITKNAETAAGCVYDPLRNEMFSAVLGNGAFLNGQPIRVSKTADLSAAYLATGFPYSERGPSIEDFARLTNASAAIRRAGSAAIDLCYVACGIFDGFFERGLWPWDYTAGALIIEEAGGKVTGFEGLPIACGSRCNIASSNGLLHADILKTL